MSKKSKKEFDDVPASKRFNEKDWLDYVRNFLPRFSHNVSMKRGTSRDFFEIARLHAETWEDIIKGAENPDKINWREVGRWNRKWRRSYPDYWNFVKMASLGRLKPA